MPSKKHRRLYQCDRCIHTYTDSAALAAHKASMHAVHSQKIPQLTDRYICTVCNGVFPSKYVVIKHMEVYHPKATTGFRLLQTCPDCNVKNLYLSAHDCPKRKSNMSISNDIVANQRSRKNLFCSSSSCSEGFDCTKMFNYHVQCRHHNNMEVMFFPDMKEFNRWKYDVEKSISIQFARKPEEISGRKFYSCVDTKVTKLFTERCPAMMVVQIFTAGVLVKFYTKHFIHKVPTYKVSKKHQKYRITDYLPTTDDKVDFDPYLDFKVLLENIAIGAAKININGLNELVGRALEMTVFLNTNDRGKEETPKVNPLQPITDYEITKALLNDPGYVARKRLSVNTDDSEPPNKKIQMDMAPKIVNTFSLADSAQVNSSGTDLDQKILLSNMLEKAKRPNDGETVKLEVKDQEFSSFNESYRQFVRRNLILPSTYSLRSSQQSRNNNSALKNNNSVRANSKIRGSSNKNRINTTNIVNDIKNQRGSSNSKTPTTNSPSPSQRLQKDKIVLLAEPVLSETLNITKAVDINKLNTSNVSDSVQDPLTTLPVMSDFKDTYTNKRTMNKTKQNLFNRKSRIKSRNGILPNQDEIINSTDQTDKEINTSGNYSEVEVKEEMDTDYSSDSNVILNSDTEENTKNSSETEEELDTFNSKQYSSEMVASNKLSVKKVDFEYEVIEQDSDCNILVLKL